MGRCLHMGAFPLESVYRPLFNAAQMRLLLMRFFHQELHFGEDVHTHVVFQIPRLGPVLKRVLKAFSTVVVGAIFSPHDQDPLPVCLSALGSDCAALEANISAGDKGTPTSTLLATQIGGQTPSRAS